MPGQCRVQRPCARILIPEGGGRFRSLRTRRLPNQFSTSVDPQCGCGAKERVVTRRIGLLWKLFYFTLELSAFTFGGGYVIVSLMKKTFVDRLHWLEDEEMLDLVAIAEAAPGSIAISGAIVVGYKLAGVTGILVTVVATALPPLVIISLISVGYEAFCGNETVRRLLHGMQAGVAAVIFSVVWDMAGAYVKRRDVAAVLIMAAAFAAAALLRINVIYVVVICIGAGLVHAWRCMKTGKGQ